MIEQVYEFTVDVTRGNSDTVIKAGTRVTIRAERDGMALVRLYPRTRSTWANTFAAPRNTLRPV